MLTKRMPPASRPIAIAQQLPLAYTRAEAARELKMSESSLDLLLRTRRLKGARKQGRRWIITRTALEEYLRHPVACIWPAKRDGKTTRHFAPPAARVAAGTEQKPCEKKPPIMLAVAEAIERHYAALEEELPPQEDIA
jgi:Helix-turn-helix domain